MQGHCTQQLTWTEIALEVAAIEELVTGITTSGMVKGVQLKIVIT